MNIFKNVVPLKDNFVTDDLPTTCASYILQGFKGPDKSSVAHLLEDSSILVVAKTNMDEFGMGSHSLNSAYGQVENGAGRQAQSAGGSSGGSAMVVADTMASIAIGSDTGGSVRLPAAYTGVFGFKPSYGRISRNGLVPYANSLDTVGIFARTVDEISAVYKILDKHDPADPTCLTKETRLRIELAALRRGLAPGEEAVQGLHIRVVATGDTANEHTDSIKTMEGKHKRLDKAQYDQPRPIRVGVPDEYNIEEIHPLVRKAWTQYLSALAENGHEIVPISLPTTQQALAAYYILAPAEASSNLAKYDGVRYGIPRHQELPDNHNGPLYSRHRGEFFGDEVKRRILLGTFTLSAGAMDNYFIQAQKVRRLVQHDFNSVFRLGHPLMDGSQNKPHGVDFIVVPTAPTVPPLISEVKSQSPLDSYINDVFTVPASLAGLPALSVPIVPDDDMPHTPEKNVGMQIIGQFGDDRKVLQFAKANREMQMDSTMNNARVWKRPRL
ncbi:Trimeric GatFAB AmidoTransferase(AdT) complex subunit [Knufia fluminis]|uniref:Glutamyl-tRNA(Gln) amidotransferase subunit A, mitochondrial n=1 Tax=Knufia fluminis TaxID=191047 RepID=A0AAN8I6R9_9EURO|nr:Trimeric GatFAB AmidoTransferase(AdT) complex subunit [Knufia fluminis]